MGEQKRIDSNRLFWWLLFFLSSATSYYFWKVNFLRVILRKFFLGGPVDLSPAGINETLNYMDGISYAYYAIIVALPAVILFRALSSRTKKSEC